MDYQTIVRVVRESGLWENGREQSHGFLLSPDVLVLTPSQAGELQEVGRALQACLGGLGRLAAIASMPGLTHGKMWSAFNRIFRTGIPCYYHGLQVLRPGTVPAVIKVDFMIDQPGRFWIAEIDGHNKHGLGYSTLAARVRRVLAPTSRSFPGVAAVLAEAIKSRGKTACTLLAADQERFYLPECRILADELRVYGVDLSVVLESEAVLGSVGPGTLLIDLPFLFRNAPLIEQLVAGFRSGEIDFLIPPKPFLGSKAVLALLRNDGQSVELESILRAHIPSAALERLREAIPPTWLIGKRNDGAAVFGANERRFVLKETISSGMKGTIFSDDPRFPEALASASRSVYRSILQEEVENRPFRFRYFDPDGLAVADDWFVRATVHYANAEVADLIVTARRDKRVHGAKDSLQLGAIIGGELNDKESRRPMEFGAQGLPTPQSQDKPPAITVN